MSTEYIAPTVGDGEPPEGEPIELVVPADQAGRRLDQVLAQLLPDFSRNRLQTWIRAGRVRVDGRPVRPRDPVDADARITLVAKIEPEVVWSGEDLPLTVLHEDVDLLVLAKPAGTVVHPAAGHQRGTLVNALLHHYPELGNLPRAGVVHRLDKDTSGLLVVARTELAHRNLVAMLQRKEVTREYLAVVNGVVTAGGTVDKPIGRHPVDRKRMAVREGARPAVTHYRVMARYRGQSLLRVILETGRTHQIRVHMAAIGHPLVGDPVYGGRPRPPRGSSEALRLELTGFRRQALHARYLALRHPRNGESLAWEAPVPDDLAALIAALEADQPGGRA